jgi:demethylmenaquinone methyltransferase/2-methoxy-6-polyprenyl-1,4-benzoquinol methylase
MMPEKPKKPIQAATSDGRNTKYGLGWSRFYDILTWLFFLPLGGEKWLRREFIDFAAPGVGEQVLDVCCGTGTLALLIAEKVNGRGRVTGVDLSPEMLSRARRKAGRDLPVIFRTGDCEMLPFPEGAFDRVFISLGLHEMSALVRQNALREIYRVLKPDRSLLIFDFHLALTVLPRLVVAASMRFFESEEASRMLVGDTLLREIEEAGFTLGSKQLIKAGVFQMLRVDKPARVS